MVTASARRRHCEAKCRRGREVAALVGTRSAGCRSIDRLPVRETPCALQAGLDARPDKELAQRRKQEDVS
jgi:hypothetical protein